MGWMIIRIKATIQIKKRPNLNFGKELVVEMFFLFFYDISALFNIAILVLESLEKSL